MCSCLHENRSGKYIKLQYGANWRLTGARTLPFLLEKSRLVHQERNERNYHVFYQLCKGVSSIARDNTEDVHGSDHTLKIPLPSYGNKSLSRSSSCNAKIQAGPLLILCKWHDGCATGHEGGDLYIILSPPHGVCRVRPIGKEELCCFVVKFKAHLVCFFGQAPFWSLKR